AAVDPAARLLDRHEQQIAVDRHIPLTAGAHHRREEARPLRAVDVVRVEPVEITLEQMIATEGEIRVRIAKTSARRLRGRRSIRRSRRLSGRRARRLAWGRGT